MPTYRVGFIGCGRPWKSEGATGFGMAHYHARGYAVSPDAEIVALADLSAENARAFQEQHGGERIYTDYREMLVRENLDIVSICTWPAQHAEMVIGCAEAGVRAIHCEKPMAPTFAEALRMEQVCRERGAQLTFNHQRRFATLFRAAREQLRAGAIGELLRLEAVCPDMFDWGTHWFDMMFLFNDETPADWVLGQVETRRHKTVFGVPMDTQGVCQIGYRNGVRGLMTTNSDRWEALVRAVGTEGTIEVNITEGHKLRVWGRGQSAWEEVPVANNEGGDLDNPVQLGVLDLIDALKTGREPELSGQRALRATELIFATYESSRRRGRVDLPLEGTAPTFAALMGDVPN